MSLLSVVSVALGLLLPTAGDWVRDWVALDEGINGGGYPAGEPPFACPIIGLIVRGKCDDKGSGGRKWGYLLCSKTASLWGS